MNRVRRAIEDFAARIGALSAGIGRRVTIDEAQIADRRRFLDLGPPGIWSPNRSCRLVKAADGWIAVNLPRESDRQMVPAWIGGRIDAPPWPAILRAARERPWRTLIDDAARLGLPVSGVGEVRAVAPEAALRRLAPGREPRGLDRIRVIDLSSLWAGPLCGAILAEAGAEVVKLESRDRPDRLRHASPAFFERLNGGKVQSDLDFRKAADLARLAEAIDAAQVLITSARPRAFEQLGLAPPDVFARNPGLTWVAITGHGWTGEAAGRVAFGDDAAAVGGLVRWTRAGDPRFLGDALADPLTGLAAAAGALEAIGRGGGLLVNAAMSRTAAGVAAMSGAA